MTRPGWRAAARSAGTAAALLLLALTAAAHVQGVRAVPVLSGSMAPYAQTGSLVLTTPLDGGDVVVGDVVAFVPPAPFGAGHPVMHRVGGLTAPAGARAMTTRGDANAHPDPWSVALDGADLGRVVLVVPWAGLLAMGGPVPVLMLLGGAAALAEGARLLRAPACACPAAAAAAPAAPSEVTIWLDAPPLPSPRRAPEAPAVPSTWASSAHDAPAAPGSGGGG